MYACPWDRYKVVLDRLVYFGLVGMSFLFGQVGVFWTGWYAFFLDKLVYFGRVGMLSFGQVGVFWTGWYAFFWTSWCILDWLV